MRAIKATVEVYELNQFKESLFIDCRFDLKDPLKGRKSYLDSHIPGAIYAHLDNDLSGTKGPQTSRHPLPTPDEMKRRFERIGISSNTTVIAYDDSDMSFAARLWWMLRYLGHKKVMVLNGGFSAYKKAGLPVTSDVVTLPPGELKIAVQENMLEEVSHVLSSPCLVDSRDPARYRGEVEPIDPVAGHIPHAKNLFYRDHLDSELKFKPVEEIRALLKPFYDQNQRPTFYCGSGVTACVNVLASAHAGLAFPRLYAGSWSEWIRDPSRPIAKA